MLGYITPIPYLYYVIKIESYEKLSNHPYFYPFLWGWG